MRARTIDWRVKPGRRGQVLAALVAPLVLLAAACSPEPQDSPGGEGTSPSGLSASGLVAAYAFDEGMGTSAADASGNGHTGTLLNGAGWVAGHSGSSVNLDGVNDTVSAGNLTDLNGLSAVTVSAWVKGAVGTGSPDAIIVAKDAAFALVVGSPGHKASFGVKSGNTWYGLVSSTSNVDDGAYHFLTGTYDGTSLKIYVDGTQQRSQNVGAHVLNSPTTPLLIGSCIGGPDCSATGEMWRGSVDDVRVYNRALSLTEIQTDRDNPVSMAPPDTTPPSTPTNVAGTAVSTSQINLTWTASTDNVGVTGYRVLRNGSQVGTSATTSFSDVGLSPATMYSYTVTAIDAAMNVSSPSTAISVTTQAAADTTPPTAPTNLGGTAVSVSRIDLTWTASTDNVGVTGYRVFRNGAQIGTSTATSFSDTGLSPATTYTYTVAATDAAANVSAQSSQTPITTLADTTPPSTPGSVSGTATSSSQINLSWAASTDNVGVTGYKVFRDGSLVGSPSGTSFSETGLTASTSYSYTVAAVDAASNTSASSTPISVTTQASGAAGQVALASDNFNRPDGPLGPNWTVIDSNPVIHNQHIEETNATDGWDSIAIYTAINNWPDNQYSQVRVLAANEHGGAAPIVRALNTTVIEMYTLFVTGPLGTGAKLTLAKFITHIYTEIWSSTVTVNAGDMLYLSANGSTLTVKLNGNTITTQVDTSLTHGYAGFDLTNYVENPVGAMGDGQLDDWEAGAIGGVPPPTNLTGTAASSSRVDLSWSAPAGATGVAGYYVFRNGTQVGMSTTTSFSDQGLSLGTTYTYAVAAFDGAGNTSPTSSTISVTTLGDTTPPSVPTNLAGSADASNRVNLTWTASTDDISVAGYEVFRNGTQVGTSTTTSFTDSTIVASTTYSYTVRAVDPSNNKSAFSTPVNVTTNGVPPASPVVAFDFNEGMGLTANDSSGNNYQGTLVNGPTWTSGHTSSGLLFDGNNDYLTAGNIAALNGLRAVTVSAWIKGAVGAGSADGVVIGKDGAFALAVGINIPHKAQFAIKSGNNWFGFPASTTSVDDGAFHYVTGVYDGSAMKVYVDGNLEKSQTVGALTLAAPSAALQVASCAGGPNCDASGEMWQGTVDDVRVYNVALTGAQIVTDMNTPVP